MNEKKPYEKKTQGATQFKKIQNDLPSGLKPHKGLTCLPGEKQGWRSFVPQCAGVMLHLWSHIVPECTVSRHQSLDTRPHTHIAISWAPTCFLTNKQAQICARGCFFIPVILFSTLCCQQHVGINSLVSSQLMNVDFFFFLPESFCGGGCSSHVHASLPIWHEYGCLAEGQQDWLLRCFTRIHNFILVKNCEKRENWLMIDFVSRISAIGKYLKTCKSSGRHYTFPKINAKTTGWIWTKTTMNNEATVRENRWTWRGNLKVNFIIC